MLESRKEKVKGGMTPIVEEMIDKAITENVSTVDPGSEDAYLVAAAKTGDGHAFESWLVVIKEGFFAWRSNSLST